jgi:hypothetical protein
VLDAAELGIELLLLARLGIELGKLAQLEAEPFALLLQLVPLCLQGLELLHRAAQLGVDAFVIVPQCLQASGVVQQPSVRLHPQQGLLLVLSVEVYQHLSELAHQGKRSRGIVEEAAGASSAMQFAPQQQLIALELIAVLCQERPQCRSSINAEERLHDRTLCALAQKLCSGTLSQGELEGVHQKRLPGAGLSGDDIEPRLKLQLNVLDERDLLNP